VYFSHITLFPTKELGAHKCGGPLAVAQSAPPLIRHCPDVPRATKVWRKIAVNILHHNSPGDCARELIKPSKDQVRLELSIKKLGGFELQFLWMTSSIVVGFSLFCSGYLTQGHNCPGIILYLFF